MHIRKPNLTWSLATIAVLSFVGGTALVAKNTHTQPQAAPLVEPPANGFARAIGAEGLVEPKSEDIAIAPVVPGRVTAVRVEAGQHVRAGQVLWEQDDREVAALVPIREAEIASARAAVVAGEAAVADARVQVTMIERVTDPRAIRQEDLERRRIAVRAAEAELARHRAARARAEAALEQTRTDLARLVVTAPIDGQILKVDVRPGEYATVPARSPLAVMGDTSAMHVRVDVAEEDAPRFERDGQAYASPRGNPANHIALEFVRVEPRLIPKRNLNGDTAERVDTRVLQVIYRVAGGAAVYDGEQLDVYIEAAESPSASSFSAAESVDSGRASL